jgi:hypothetical protein
VIVPIGALSDHGAVICIDQNFGHSPVRCDGDRLVDRLAILAFKLN